MPTDKAASRGPRFPNDASGLVAVLNNRADFERAESEHWYRIPEKTAPDGVEKIRWIAFYLTQTFGREKWSVRYWAKVERIDRRRRVELLPPQAGHPRAQDWYHRIALDRLQVRHEPILSRRRRRVVFIPSIWKKFQTALEINDLVHGSPLEDRLPRTAGLARSPFQHRPTDEGSARLFSQGVHNGEPVRRPAAFR